MSKNNRCNVKNEDESIFRCFCSECTNFITKYLEKEEYEINDRHSIITSLPIDLELYPLVSNVKIYKIEVNKNEFLTLPKEWFHWIFTEPNTVAVSFEIHNFIGDNSDSVYNSFSTSIPYKSSITKKINFHGYKDMIKKNLNNKFRAILSESKDCSPVYKDETYKIFYHNTLKNIIKFSEKNNLYCYIGNHRTISDSQFENISRYANYFNLDSKSKIKYYPNIWFNLDKKIESGLHSDLYDGIICVLEGKKTIYLMNPKESKNLYIKKHLLLKNVYN